MRFDVVFEGGGSKGMVLVDALQAFEAAGRTPGRLLGTSAGAITATLLAAGYSAEELRAVISEREGEHPVFATFMGLPDATEGDAIRASATRAMLRELDLPFVPHRIEDALDDRIAAWTGASPHLRLVFSFVEHGVWSAAENFLKWMQRSLDAGTFRGARSDAAPSRSFTAPRTSTSRWSRQTSPGSRCSSSTTTRRPTSPWCGPRACR